jgi:hypothetical protein
VVPAHVRASIAPSSLAVSPSLLFLLFAHTHTRAAARAAPGDTVTVAALVKIHHRMDHDICPQDVFHWLRGFGRYNLAVAADGPASAFTAGSYDCTIDTMLAEIDPGDPDTEVGLSAVLLDVQAIMARNRSYGTVRGVLAMFRQPQLLAD